MRHLSDPADALLARDDDLEVHTQHSMSLDSAPDFHGSHEDEEALFAGLSGKPARKVKLPKAAGVQQVKPGSAGAPMVRVVHQPPQQRVGGFMPGMGGLGDVASARRMGAPAKHVLSRGQNRARPAHLAGPRPNGGFIPGLGDVSIAGMGLGTLALISAGAWFLLRRKRA